MMKAIDAMASREYDRSSDPYLNMLEEQVFHIVINSERRFVRSSGHIETFYDEPTLQKLSDIKQRYENYVRKYYPEEVNF